MSQILYVKKKGKWLFSKDSVYFTLTDEQIKEMENIFEQIKKENHDNN